MKVAPLASLYQILIGLFLLTLVGAFAGMRMAEIPSVSRRVLPFSGGLLVGIALFWILPEIAERDGWLGGCAGLIAGFSLLFLIDRYLYPVCPTCSHTHHHEDCARSLHGFAAPLLIASGLHSFFDGWSLVVSQQKGFEGLKVAFLVGIGVHKLPEGLALGALLIAALGKEWRAMLGATAAQCMMLGGSAVALLVADRLAPQWTIAFLSVAAGAFVYLGYHAVDSEYQQRGFRTAWMPALTGAAGAAILRAVVPGV
ncbi:MAG: ZIP family metal transporter [Bryobacteraceae bacterium]